MPSNRESGPGQVDELEDAERGARRLGEPGRVQAAVVDPHQLPRFHVPDERRAHDVQRAGLRGEAEPVGQASDRQRPDPERIARRVDAPFVHEDEAEGAGQGRKELQRGVLEAVRRHLLGEHRRHHVGVGGGAAPPARELRELVRVHQVTVVAEGDRADSVGLEDRLRVVPGAGAGRGIPGVPDGQVAVERRQRGLVEDLADQAELLVHEDVVPVADRDAGRFLAPVLLGEQTEVREAGDVLAGSPYAEEPTFLFR